MQIKNIPGNGFNFQEATPSLPLRATITSEELDSTLKKGATFLNLDSRDQTKYLLFFESFRNQCQPKVH